MSMKFIRSTSENKDFVHLVARLDAHLKIRDGEDHDFYNQYNHIDSLQHVLVIYNQERAVGCGAFKKFDYDTVEIKRMYVHPGARGKKLGSKIVTAIEQWATELGFSRFVLETGKRMPEATGLYKKNGYKIIANYGPYIGMDNSVCFEKDLRNKSR